MVCMLERAFSAPWLIVHSTDDTVSCKITIFIYLFLPHTALSLHNSNVKRAPSRYPTVDPRPKMSHRKMYLTTKKAWERLPEVKKKVEEEKKRSQAATNRLRAKLYQKVCSLPSVFSPSGDRKYMLGIVQTTGKYTSVYGICDSNNSFLTHSLFVHAIQVSAAYHLHCTVVLVALWYVKVYNVLSSRQFLC